MTFEEFVSGIKQVKHLELRKEETNYLEIVFSRDSFPALMEVLRAYFGEPAKAQGQAPSAAQEACTKPYGGVFSNQILYASGSGKIQEMAMLWPWSDPSTMTVKVARQ